uniref:BTB domain-containing protein n=1 Tax=Panagrellus redivivus TaxID=6233 RepID=A0A7E4VKE9_PANRE
MSLVKHVTDSSSISIKESDFNDSMVGNAIPWPDRSIKEISGLKWHVDIYPAGDDWEYQQINTGQVDVYLVVSKPVNAFVTFQIKGTNTTHSEYVTFGSNDRELVRAVPGFVLHEDLRNSGAIKKGKFVIRCEVKFDIPIAEFPAPPPIYKLLKEDCNTVNLVTENLEIEANKSILTEISPIFSAMFTHNMVESRTGEVHIVDLDSDTVRNVIDYCLGKNLNTITLDGVLNMLKFADKYNINGLTEHLETFLIDILNYENAATIYKHADLHSRENLKNACAKLRGKMSSRF